MIIILIDNYLAMATRHPIWQMKKRAALPSQNDNRGTMRNGSCNILVEMRRLANEIILKSAEQEGADIIPRDFAALLDKADDVFNAENVLMALNLMEAWKQIALKSRCDEVFISGYENGYQAGQAGDPHITREAIIELLPEALTAVLLHPSHNAKV